LYIQINMISFILYPLIGILLSSLVAVVVVIVW